jgi:hypothetical protein
MTDHQKTKPRWWTSYWVVIFLATIVLGVTLPVLSQVPIEKAALYLIVALIFEGLAYYGRVKPSINLNRIMYILIGVPMGFILWYFSWFFVIRSLRPQAGQDFALVILSLIVSFAIGGFIGELIGRLRHYKGPEKYQP